MQKKSHPRTHRFISADELREVMKTLGDYMSNEDIEEMLGHADKNGDGRIDYEGAQFSTATKRALQLRELSLYRTSRGLMLKHFVTVRVLV